MRTTYVTVSAAGASQWIPLDVYRNPFSVSLGCTISSGATLTYAVNHTFDNPWDMQPVKLTRVTTTATAVLPAHGLVATTDSVIVEGAGAPFDGTYAVASIVDANTFTYTVANSGLTTSLGGTVSRMRTFIHSSITGKTANSDGNYAYPVAAIRLNITSYTSGNVTLAVTQGT